jgi:hypothetical protein
MVWFVGLFQPFSDAINCGTQLLQREVKGNGSRISPRLWWSEFKKKIL